MGAAEPSLIDAVMASSDALRGELASLELRDQTLPVADGKQLSQDITLRGAFFKALLPKLMHDDPEVRRRAVLSLQIGLSAIEGRRIVGRREDR